MAAQSTLELILEMKDKMKTGIIKAKQNVSGAMQDMKKNVEGFKNKAKEHFDSFSDNARKKITDLKHHHVEAFSAMKSEIPGLGRAVELLKNPYVLVTAAVVALGVAMTNTLSKAADFNHEFLELKNLNLDKTEKEISNVKNSILDLSLKTGMGAKELSKGFFDVQSATGKFGKEVELINEKVANFSIATKADFGNSINSATKAMEAFGLGVNQLDNYLISNAKTVQEGITTFDELARVQTEYAGSAASLGQTVDTANKIFASLSKSTKDSAIAATMAKGAFDGFTNKNTIEKIEGLGIDIFDANKEMRSMDHIIRDLIPKLKNMSGKDFATLKNEIGGPEGLQKLLNRLKTSGDEVIKSFDAFDKSEFSIEAALANAKGDFITLKNLVSNQINTLFIKLGDVILPKLAQMLYKVHIALQNAKPYFEFGISFMKNLYHTIKPVLAPLWDLIKVLGLVKIGLVAINLVIAMNPFIAITMAIIGVVAAFKTLYKENDNFKAWIDGLMAMFKSILPFLESIGKAIMNVFNPAKFSEAVANVAIAWNNMDLKKSFSDARNATLERLKKERAAEEKESKSLFTDETEDITDGGKRSGFEVESGASSGRAVGDPKTSKNISIQIGTLHRGEYNIYNHKNGDMQNAYSEFERMMSEYLLRIVRDAEASI